MFILSEYFYLKYTYMFEVVNPAIVGIFKVKYDENSPVDAAKRFWNELSKIVVNELPKSYFTLRDDNGKLYHYKVTEEKSGTNMADYMLTQIEKVDEKKGNLVSETFDKIMARYRKGGKKHRYDDDNDDSPSDSSSSDEDDLVKKYDRIRSLRKKQPIIYYHYIPSIYADESVFMPSFIYPIVPAYVEINSFSSAFWE